MKKFYLGITLMVTGAMIIAGALIGGGLVANGKIISFSSYSDIIDSDLATTFVFIGCLLFIIGLVLACIFAFKKEEE